MSGLDSMAPEHSCCAFYGTIWSQLSITKRSAEHWHRHRLGAAWLAMAWPPRQLKPRTWNPAQNQVENAKEKPEMHWNASNQRNLKGGTEKFHVWKCHPGHFCHLWCHNCRSEPSLGTKRKRETLMRRRWLWLSPEHFKDDANSSCHRLNLRQQLLIIPILLKKMQIWCQNQGGGFNWVPVQICRSFKHVGRLSESPETFASPDQSGGSVSRQADRKKLATNLAATPLGQRFLHSILC